jgi:hypothetical protein
MKPMLMTVNNNERNVAYSFLSAILYDKHTDRPHYEKRGN